jgi:hypothetical protein
MIGLRAVEDHSGDVWNDRSSSGRQSRGSVTTIKHDNMQVCTMSNEKWKTSLEVVDCQP